MKFLRTWKWENTWFVFSIVSLVVLPWILALAFVPALGAVYAGLSSTQLLVPAAFGFGWGIAQVLFGLSVARLGLALGYAIIVGLGALLGTLVPLIFQNWAAVDARRLTIIFAGITVMIAGIVVSAWAGQRRESKQVSSGYGAALGLAIVCGLLAPMLNYGFAFGQDIARAAMAAGASEARAGYAVWPVALAGGFVPNIAYSAYLLGRNRTWGLFVPAPGESRFGVLMAVLWMGAMAIYGVAAALLGTLGTSVGWALFQIFMIMTANASGIVTGEWKQATASTRAMFWTGFGLLALATAIISFSNAQGTP
jgi:L-rhamnose-H+ transport protein